MTPKPILELRSEVVDQIAAGEVVERPSHLVKELIENALDAGAGNIEIDVADSGRTVQITDDGVGIRPADLPSALRRHATSKISKAEDLWALSSFGFRGEALASIAAVSRVEVISRPIDDAVAYRVRADFGAILPVELSSGNPGTTVQVQSLFENVPARLKFMKSELAEISQIKQTVKAFSLSNPGVSFRLKSRGRVELHFPPVGNFIDRAKAVLGTALYPAAGEFEGIYVEAAIAAPSDVQGNSRGIWLFAQGRWIQDRSLQAAVGEAYRGLLMGGEYPIAAVKINVPDGDIDVNISPTKSAVKFRDPSRVFRAVSKTIRTALERAPWMGDGTRGAAKAAGASIGSAEHEPRQAMSLSLNDFVRPYKSGPPESKQTVAIVTDQGEWSRLKVIGQAGLTYLICDDGDKIVFVDQHAAHERVAFERLMAAWREGGIETQALLIPLVVEMEPDHVEALLSYATDLSRMGFHVESMGPRSIAVSAFPALLKESAVKSGLVEFAARTLERGGSFVLEEKITDVFARMACHSVVRAGQALTVDQMQSLLVQMDEFPLSSFCPHGRPVSVEYSYQRLERDFGRTV